MEPLKVAPSSLIFSEVMKMAPAASGLDAATGAVRRPPESLDQRRCPDRRSKQITRPSRKGWYIRSPSTVGASRMVRSVKYSQARLKGSPRTDPAVAPASATVSIRAPPLRDWLGSPGGFVDCRPGVWVTARPVNSTPLQRTLRATRDSLDIRSPQATMNVGRNGTLITDSLCFLR